MELAPGVHSIGQRKGGRSHAFLFVHGSELTLVDTLFDTDAHVLLDYMRRIGRAPRELKHIVLTHAHRSHLGGLATLKRLSGATVHAHESEADIINGERLAQPVTMRPIRPLRTYPHRIGLALGRPPHVACPVDEAVGDDDSVGPLQVLHTPGHSPGHLALHWPERRVLLAGDAIATWPELHAGWRGWILNERQHRASLHALARLEADVVGVGHGEAITQNTPDRVHALAEELG